ncbi:CPBP family intramembrane glutamic endopeptidase [Microlunatus ginsengisoli]|uniref:CPBP family intramembrane glutamic endopeptidase n=1 Tax=Microlunatus ginsengisoli TaxID=363863 RepID=UPI0031DAF626
MSSIPSERGRTIRPRRLVTFVLIAYLGAWLIELPLWLGDGLREPSAKVLISAMMLAPAVAAFVTVRLWPDGRKVVDELGLRPGPFRRWWWTMLVAWFGPPLLAALAVGIAYVFGRFLLDWGTWSSVRTLLGGRPVPIPMSTLVPIVIAQSLLTSVWIAAVFAVGEEIGWRGFLRDELSVLPRWLLILITGVIWGLWHAPVILLGYNYYGMPPVVGLLCMVVFTTLVAALLEWLRTRGTAIWPTALAHGSINTAAAAALLLTPAARPPAALWDGLLGWPGWLVMALAVAVLVLTGALRWKAIPAAEPRNQTVRSARSGSVPGRVDDGDPSPVQDEIGGRS